MEQPPTEAQLLEKVRNSSVEDFRVLFDRYQPIVFRHALFQVREPELAHDIVQETFLRIWEHRFSLMPNLSFLAYALRIAGNVGRDTFRYRNTRERLKGRLPQPALSEGDDPEAALQREMLETQLATIINKELPERCRTIFLLSRFERKTNREIAELLGISVRTVEHQINHALKTVRQNLKGYL
jgi:RNA polymerase sigma-70 factor (ECF subfamily)